MTFSVIPAIDVAGGRLVVWTPEGSKPQEAFGGDPAAAAAAFATAGASWLHVVDTDHALQGGELDTSAFGEIRRAASDVRVQASGGMGHADIDACMRAGADRVVLGSAALADVGSTEALLARRRDDVIFGIEIEDGRVRARGREPVELDLMQTLGWLAAAGAGRFLVTAVSRVGGLEGPDVETIRRVVRTGRPVVAAGGISSLEGLRAARAAGAVGAVVGRAAMDGSLDLREAFAWAAGS